ncbi:MAG: L,D-transpeptidase family protein [Patescibacteria group bacterium]
MTLSLPPFDILHTCHARPGHPVIFSCVLIAAALGGSFLSGASTALAFTKQRPNELQIGTDVLRRVKLFDGKFKGGATVAAADVNGDGVDEFVVGAGATGGSQVQIYRQDRTLIRSFFAFPPAMKDGITVAAGDLNGDGQAEIVVGPQPGHTPQVLVFSATGKKLYQFTSFESSFAGGVDVAVIPSRQGLPGNIVVSSGFGREAEVRVYDATGKNVIASWSPFGKTSSNGATVAAGWSDAYGGPVVVVGAGQGEKPLVQVYGLTSKQKLAQWLAYDPRIKAGVAVAVRNDIVITGPSVGGGPDVRMFTIRGQLQSSRLVYENNFRGGLNVAAAVINGLVTPLIVPTSAPTTAAAAGKRIVIDLSKQELTMYEKGKVISIRPISTGKWSTPTPTGEFKTRNKIPVAYSKAYGLYMENWMAITPDGKYGMHALPFWKLKGGGKLYEGAAHIGTPVSHGCIRQTVADAKSLYDWAPIGTPVTIVK